MKSAGRLQINDCAAFFYRDPVKSFQGLVKIVLPENTSNPHIFSTKDGGTNSFLWDFFLSSPQHNVEFIVPLIAVASGLLIKSHILFSQDTGASKHRLTNIHEILPDRKGIPIKTDF